MENLESAMSKIFSSHAERGGYFFDEEIERITDLLVKMDRKAWSIRPRTYAVLRMMDNVAELMDKFVEENFFDINFPYTPITLPLIVKGATERHKFIKKQAFILTDAKSMENGSHSHLAKDANMHFNVIRPLGRGGFGAVDEVRSNLSCKNYARKILLRNVIFNGIEQEKSFRNELQNLKRFSHHHLVQYIGSYTDLEYFGILILPVAECNLQQFLNKPSLTPNELSLIRQFFGCITSGVAYIHRNTCRHKDITPRNILVNRGVVYITDFGLAYDWTDESKSKTYGKPGAMSLNYAAPEVFTEGNHGSATDMWSLGCTFLDMVTVLKGETLDARKDFFNNAGTKHLNPQDNDAAYILWMDKLDKLNSRHDKHPWSWIKGLLQRNPEERLGAPELLKTIQLCDDSEDGYVYYCLRCDASVRVPITIPDAQIIREEVEQNDNVDTENITLSRIQDGLLLAVSRDDRSDTRQWLKRSERLNISVENCQVSLGSPTNALHIAARQGNRDIAADLLKYGFDINAKSMGSTPLHIAIENCKDTVMKFLVDQGADVSLQDEKNDATPLCLAAAKGLQSATKFLLENGANINAVNRGNCTALHLVAFEAQEEVLVTLLKDPMIDTTIHNVHGLNPLHVAALNGHERIVRKMLDYKVDIDARDSKLGNTALHYAVANAKKLVVRLLIERGAQVNICQTSELGNSPLHLAARNIFLEEAKELLTGSVDPEVTDTYGCTALHVAVATNNLEMTRLLLEHGFDVNRPINKEGMKAVPLMIAVPLGKIAMVELLLKHHAKIEVTGVFGETHLHHLASAGNLEMLEVFLKHGANIEARNKDEWTPLMVAIARGHLKVVEKLLESDADTQGKGPLNWSALHQAADYQREEIVKVLLDRNASVDAQDSRKYTPLHVTAMRGNCAIAKLLVRAGAKLDLEDIVKRTPMLHAVANGHKELAEYLKAHYEMTLCASLS